MSKMEIQANNGETVIKNIFKVFEQKYGKEGLITLYSTANFDFLKFLSGDRNLNDFLAENVSSIFFSSENVCWFLLFFFTQNFDYLTMKETAQPEKFELDNDTKEKLSEMMRNPDVDADILWIEVSLWRSSF